MPIYVDDNGKVIVEFGGDIFTGTGVRNGRGFMIFTQGTPGEIGRDLGGIELNTSPENPGVVFVARDHRSLDVVIRNLTKVRDKLVETDPDSDVSGDRGEGHNNTK